MARIALIVARIEAGGVLTVNSRLAEGLSDLGHEVELISIKDFDNANLCLGREIRVRTLNATRAIGSVRLLRRVYQNDGFDVCIVSQLYLGVVAMIAALFCSHPNIVVVEHSSVSYWRLSGKWKDRFVLTLAPLMLRRVDAFASVSRLGANEWSRALRLAGSKCRFLPNPVLRGDEQLFSDFVSQHRSGLLFVGRLSPEKQVEDLLREYSEIVGMTDEDLTIAGDGPLRQDLELLVEELGISDRVHFLGMVDDPSLLMQSNRVLLLCSRFEGMPTVLIEALANGCEVISKDCPTGPAEILRDGEFGVLVDQADSGWLKRSVSSTSSPCYSKESLVAHLRQFSVTESTLRYDELLKEIGLEQSLFGND
jgi:glycosyltransferase involved in cell wall biosynthesis